MDLPSRPAVVLTRSREDNRALADALRARGACVVELPCLRIEYLRPAPPEPARVAVFSSRHGVRGWQECGLSLPAGCSRAAVGPATAAALAAAGLPARWIADPPEGAALARLLCEDLARGARVLLVQGNLRAGKLEPPLRQAGFELATVEVYRNLEAPLPSTPRFPVAMVFCASPSAARRLLEAQPWLRTCRFACIGQTTAAALSELGVTEPLKLGATFDNWLETLARAAVSAENHSDN